MITSTMKIRALAELIHHVRPEWNRGGILTALNAQPERPFPELTRAALDSAWDRSATTPAVIAHRDGTAWASAIPVDKPTSVPGNRSCQICGRFHVVIDGILEPCYRHDPVTAERGIAKVREALKAAREAPAQAPEPPRPRLPQHAIDTNQRGVDAARQALSDARQDPAT